MNLKILLIEDDHDIRSIIKKYLATDNRIIETVDSGEEAIAKLNSDIYDLCIIDVILAGDITGLDLLKYIKVKQKLETEVIIITGNRNIGEAIESIKLGAFHYITKPIVQFELFDQCLEFINKHKKLTRLPNEVIRDFKYTNFNLNENKYKVLIVDDDYDCRSILKDILTNEGLIIEEAEDAAHCYQKLKDFKPNLIILDIMMPDEDGFAVAKKIKQNDELLNIPILIVSAKSLDKDFIKGIESGADDYLIKPFSVPRVISKAKALLRIGVLLKNLKNYSFDLLQELQQMKKLRSQIAQETAFIGAINKSLSLDDKCNIIRKYFTDISQINLFSIFIVKNNYFELLVHNHIKLPKKIEISENKTSPMYEVLEKKKPLLISDYSKSKFYNNFTRKKYKQKSAIIFPLFSRGKIIGLLNLNNKQGEDFTPAYLHNYVRVFDHLANSIDNSLLFNETKQLSIRDELTGLYNRRYFHDKLNKEIALLKRTHRNISLLIIDIDNFKKFNDDYGHLAGDQVLKKLSFIINDTIREIDIPVRYGGEEFIILVPESNRKESFKMANRLKNNVEKNLKLEINGNITTGVTISGGISDTSETLEISKLIDTADNRLYNAKKNGKNQIIYE